jgi:hypothetical protein
MITHPTIYPSSDPSGFTVCTEMIAVATIAPIAERVRPLGHDAIMAAQRGRCGDPPDRPTRPRH